jgi:hypothetical protein
MPRYLVRRTPTTPHLSNLMPIILSVHKVEMPRFNAAGRYLNSHTPAIRCVPCTSILEACRRYSLYTSHHPLDPRAAFPYAASRLRHQASPLGRHRRINAGKPHLSREFDAHPPSPVSLDFTCRTVHGNRLPPARRQSFVASPQTAAPPDALRQPQP